MCSWLARIMDRVPLVVSGSGGAGITFTPAALFTLSLLAEKPVEGRANIGVHCHVYIRYGAGSPAPLPSWRPNRQPADVLFLIPGTTYFFNPVKSESAMMVPPPGITVAENFSESSMLAEVFSVTTLCGTLLTTNSVFPN
jgi:hypothetical protein